MRLQDQTTEPAQEQRQQLTGAAAADKNMSNARTVVQHSAKSVQSVERRITLLGNVAQAGPANTFQGKKHERLKKAEWKCMAMRTHSKGRHLDRGAGYSES